MRRPCGWAQAAATPWEGCWHHSVRRMGAPLLRTAGAAMLRMHGPGIEKGSHPGLPSSTRQSRSGGLGERRREARPRSSHGEWAPASDRADPIRLLEEQAETRVQDLVPIRYGRMSRPHSRSSVAPPTSWRPIWRTLRVRDYGSSCVATPTCRTSAPSPAPPAGWCSTSTTSTRRCRDRGSGT